MARQRFWPCGAGWQNKSTRGKKGQGFWPRAAGRQQAGHARESGRAGRSDNREGTTGLQARRGRPDKARPRSIGWRARTSGLADKCNPCKQGRPLRHPTTNSRSHLLDNGATPCPNRRTRKCTRTRTRNVHVHAHAHADADAHAHAHVHARARAHGRARVTYAHAHAHVFAHAHVHAYARAYALEHACANDTHTLSHTHTHTHTITSTHTHTRTRIHIRECACANAHAYAHTYARPHVVVRARARAHARRATRVSGREEGRRRQEGFGEEKAAHAPRQDVTSKTQTPKSWDMYETCSDLLLQSRLFDVLHISKSQALFRVRDVCRSRVCHCATADLSYTHLRIHRGNLRKLKFSFYVTATNIERVVLRWLDFSATSRRANVRFTPSCSFRHAPILARLDRCTFNPLRSAGSLR